MKLKDGIVLRSVAGETVVLPSGEAANFDMMITFNDTGRFLWEKLETETDEAALVKAVLAEYDVSEDRAVASVQAFVARLKELDFFV